MKALSVLGTSSSAGKSWMTTAFCAWLHREGVRVAPFKAQNMSNNALVTADGGEIARAQAVQAEACGVTPRVENNPILLKPNGGNGAQLVLLGQAQGHFEALEYYRDLEALWTVVAGVLDGWRDRCDVLVLEGAGSPVELNLMDRDLVNLRPIRYLDGRWVLVGDIDRGGIYAQLAGTWNLLPLPDRLRGLGAIINRFRGDLRLFPDPQQWLAPHATDLRVLGIVPWRRDLQPDEEDGIDSRDLDRGTGDLIAWVRTPHSAILNDCQPWWADSGVRVRWTSDPGELGSARAIILPGTKNTIADLRWLRASGMADALIAAARRGVLIVGICGGYQILGEALHDPMGVAGDAGDEPGLGLLPLRTTFSALKILKQVVSECERRRWMTYEIHMGRSEATAPCEPLHTVRENGMLQPEGMRRGNVWGTYQHGWFEVPETRLRVAQTAGLTGYQAYAMPWAEQRQTLYRQMADWLTTHVDLDPVRRYLEL